MSHDPAPIICKARYAKNQMAVHCPSNGTGWKTRAMRLADAIANGRYSGREHAYIMSQPAAKRFTKLYAEGWDASFMSRDLIAPEKESA